MHIFKLIAAASILLLMQKSLPAQTNPDAVYDTNIHTVRLHPYGDQESMAIYKLNSTDRIELHFDDMDTRVKSYYYTYLLCDYNWQPVNLSPFDFIKGFTQQRISGYRFSSIAYTRYIHYQAVLPEANCMPTRSGNYLVKVFLDGDTSKLVFTKSLLVLDSKASVSAQVVQPFTPDSYNTHQHIKFTVNVEGLNTSNASQQVKVVVLQNGRWDIAQGNVLPTFIRNNLLEYSNENSFVFAGGKEWRWLDLRSFSLLSERVDSASPKRTDLYVKADGPRSGQRYVYYADLDGKYLVTTYETVNPYWQGDYANIHFKYVPPANTPFADKNLYLIGQLTDYQLNESSKMHFNTEKDIYENTLFLKQGYYSYGYALVDKNDLSKRTDMDGNYWETENNYTVLVYYKSFTDQADQLIGIARINTRSDRPGFSF
ncbi:DUF5103 domain-containing protein [Ferruginibacter sp.]|uniref:type IX secretion system plug protein n=1 Tax=Ferruginibacter sp. TaxID=1940288 RepID=UPI002658FBCC|nr:DUF5103 domain-containing protein [Ferruginibacter sp.]